MPAVLDRGQAARARRRARPVPAGAAAGRGDQPARGDAGERPRPGRRPVRRYRGQVLRRLHGLGYQTWWELVHASEHGVPQLRPRFMLVAMRAVGRRTSGGRRRAEPPPTVGEALDDLMRPGGWPGAAAWARARQRHRPTHRRRQQEARRARPRPDPGPGGVARLGRQTGSAWPTLRPGPTSRPDQLPKLTLRMAARAAGLPRRLGVLRPQDRRLPPDGQRVPAPGGPGPRRSDPVGDRDGPRGPARYRPRSPREPSCGLTAVTAPFALVSARVEAEPLRTSSAGRWSPTSQTLTTQNPCGSAPGLLDYLEVPGLVSDSRPIREGLWKGRPRSPRPALPRSASRSQVGGGPGASSPSSTSTGT